MYVIKRDGNREPVRFDKITNRLQKLIDFEDVDPILITQKLSSRITQGITTTELDILASQICMSMVMDHPNFGVLAARIAISNHQKNTDESILNVAKELYNNVDENNESCHLISDELYEIICKDYKIIDDMIHMERDFLLDFFGFKTLEKSYLLKVGAKNKKIVERPQHLFMRVALGIYGNDFENVKNLYDNMSLKNYTHATPTLFNAGIKYPQLSSCFEKNTLVNTLKGPIPIKDICIGDEVITHLGNVKKVVQIHKNPINNRKLYEVEIVKTNKFIVTEDHKLRIYNKKTNNIEWKSVNKLEQTDYVMIPKYSGCIDEHEIDCINILNNYKFDDNTIVCNNLNDINILSSKELLSLLKEKGIKGCHKLSKENLIKKLKADKIETQFVQYSLTENKLINTYNSLNEASLKTNISKSQILAASSNGKSKKNSAGGFKWERKNKKIPYEEPEINDKFIFTMTSVTNNNLNNINKEVTCYIKSIPIFRKIIINKDYCKFLGIWYGDGHIITKKNQICGIGITIHKDNKNLIDFCINMKEHFGLKNVCIHNMKKQNIIQVLYNSVPLGIVFYSLYGKGFNGKKLNKDIYKYSNDLLLSFISGLITSDGWITKTGTIGLQLSNKILIQEIYSLLRMNNIPVSGLRKIQMKKYTHTQGYSLQLTCLKDNLTDIWKTYKDCRINKLKIKQQTNNENTCINFDSFNFLKFKNKKEVSIEDDFVYTLGVEDDHSYSIEGIIAQNCYLIGTEDSVEGIFETITDCAKISKWSGGIGVHISNIRANGSYIRKTAGHSDGILPMLKVYNDTARYINQCFAPKTIVYTTTGPKFIENIDNNDYVITIDGTPRKVLGIKKNNVNKNILKIKTTYSRDFVEVTREHEIYALKNQKKPINFSTIKNRLDNNIIKEEYVLADELTTDDFLCYPIPQIKNINIFDNDIIRFYGIMVGDGHLTKHKIYNSIQGGITCGPEKSRTLEFVKNTLTKLNIYWSEHSENENKIRISWTHTNCYDKLGFSYDDIYIEGEKYINSKFLNCSETNLLYLIMGLIETDGHVGKEIYFYSTSLNVIESLRYCLLRLGILSSGYSRNRIGQFSSYKNIITKKIEHVLRIPKDKKICEMFNIKYSNKFGYFKHKNILYSRIKKIEDLEYEGDVYDLNIEDNHNYLTQMGLVHNSGRRNGSFALYLEPWHADVYDFLDAKKNIGSDEIRARDLFYALWVPDLFMETVEKDGDWHLMCPNVCPGLPDVYGDKFNELYNKYVSEGKYVKKIKARDLWKAIISAQVELGIPYIGYKDHVNRKNNQSNIGTIKSSNLCIEINEVSDSNETAVCNLSSICLPSIVKKPNAINEVQNSQWQFLLKKDEKDIIKRIYKGKLKLFSKSDCDYCKLLKAILKETNLEYEEINDEQAEKYRIMSENFVKPFETVPQLFTLYDNKVYHIGGYDDTWSLLKPRISHEKLYDLSYELIKNLNKVIDKNFYPTEKTKISNMRHRPVGLGVQGLADVFLALKLPFDSEESRKINKEIFETIYFGAMTSSCDIAKEEGAYSTFKGSHLSEGKFQFNLWGLKDEDLSGKWNWFALREKVQAFGVRNSLLVALMPTASTSQIMGSYVECFEPLTSNLYNRRTLAGEFTIINPYLIKDLISLDLWNEDVKNRLQYDKGSVQNIKGLPKFLKDIYKTAYELPQKSIITMSAERAPFVCQSQSLNLFFDRPDFKKLTAAHFLGWKLGLKTGSYYIRSKPAMSSQRFGMDIDKEKALEDEDSKECLTCSA